MKKLCVLFAFVLLLLTGCNSSMPFNGETAFHSITLTVPDDFIRDSTQSTEDFWVFECDNYSKCILLSRSDASGDARQICEDYVELMQERGTDSQIITFLNNDAVHSTYYQDDLFCQEIVFVYDNSSYAVALRGGTEEEFIKIMGTIALVNSTGQG